MLTKFNGRLTSGTQILKIEFVVPIVSRGIHETGQLFHRGTVCQSFIALVGGQGPPHGVTVAFEVLIRFRAAGAARGWYQRVKDTYIDKYVCVCVCVWMDGWMDGWVRVNERKGTTDKMLYYCVPSYLMYC